METIRDRAKSFGLGPTALATVSGLPRPTVVSHFYGHRKPDYTRAKAYAKVFGVTAEEILDGTPTPPADAPGKE